jgi:hypothetical protein
VFQKGERGLKNIVIESSRLVAQKSRFVSINQERVKDLSYKIAVNKYPIPPWERGYHFIDNTIRTAVYVLVLDSINFCFWPEPGKPRWKVSWKGERYSGYYALAIALKLAFEKGVPLNDPDYLEGLSYEEFRGLMGGSGELQLMKERHRILNELGRILNQEFRGDIGAVIKGAHGSALSLVNILVEKFPFFRDQAEYEGIKVHFYKRAQILVADLHEAFKGRFWGNFRDIDRLSAFADYKLPQVLRHLGVIDYSPDLSARIDAFDPIPHGSMEEVEIRANTIWAVELIKEELRTLGRELKSMEIDRLLWSLGQKDKFRQHPYHRTVTIHY